MSPRFTQGSLRGGAAACALLSAVAHLLLAPEHIREVPYIGVLFVVGAVVLLASAGALAWRNALPAWLTGALVSGGMIVGFALSRTVGLPDYKEEGWDAPYGVICMIAEVLFLAAFGAWYGVRGTSPAHAA